MIRFLLEKSDIVNKRKFLKPRFFVTASLLNPRTSNIRDMERPLPLPKFYFTTYVVSGVGATGSFEIEFISTEKEKATAHKLIPP